MPVPKPPKAPFIRLGQQSLFQLFKRGWNEIPEVMGAGVYGLLGVGLICYALYDIQRNEDKWSNHRYKTLYTVYRPDDERVCRIKKFEDSPQPTSSPLAIRELYQSRCH